MVDTVLREYSNCLTLRIRMPISADLTARNFVTKIVNYAKVVDVPNSMTVLEDLLPVAIKLAQKYECGIINFCNPGVISHNELLQMYKDLVDPRSFLLFFFLSTTNITLFFSFTWTNFTQDECNAILKAPRSNNHLDTSKLESVAKVRPIKEACRAAFLMMALDISTYGRDNLIQRGWKFPQKN